MGFQRMKNHLFIPLYLILAVSSAYPQIETQLLVSSEPDSIRISRLTTGHWHGTYLDLALFGCEMNLQIEVKGQIVQGDYFLERVSHAYSIIDSGTVEGFIVGDSVRMILTSFVRKSFLKLNAQCL